MRWASGSSWPWRRRRLATTDTLLALPEVTLGQIPGSGGSQRVARMVGLTRAVDMMMLGGDPGPEAHAWAW